MGSSLTGAVTSRPVPSDRRYDFTNETAASSLLVLLFVLGAFAMLPVSIELMKLWRDDPLRSFGALIPFVSCLLIARAWKRLGWCDTGSAWGLLPAAAAIVLARTVGTVLIAYRFGDSEITPVQPGLLFFAFGSGIVLLLGGGRLWRRSLLPLCLLLCVNPVPHLFERLDFPLQTISAETARGFAHMLGLQPTGEQLQMMFAPRFGMVIVPGCNGVRGSATMVYLALLIGYWRGMGWKRTSLLMLAGLCTGYLLNLLRLCSLVVYYWLGVHFPNVRGDGEFIDYCIGGTLFLLVCFAAGFLLLRPVGNQPTDVTAHNRFPARVNWGQRLAAPRWWATALFILVACFSEGPAAWAMVAEPSGYVPPQTAARFLPEDEDPWRAVSHFDEIYYDRPVWYWTTFQKADGTRVDLGIWLSPKRHYAIQSRLMNGSKPLLGQPLMAQSRDGVPADFSTFTLQDDLVDNSKPVPTFFAETICLPSRCNIQESGFGQGNGWIIALYPANLRMQKHLPLLFRVQSTPGGVENDQVEAEARRQIADLVAHTDFRALVEGIGSR